MNPELPAPPYRIKLFLADDHRLIIEAWTAVFNADGLFDVVGFTTNSCAALDLIKDCRPDVVLADINMAPVDGYALTSAIKAWDAGSRVIAVSCFDMPSCMRKMFMAGADGYVTKTSSFGELKDAVYAVYMGEKYTCSEISQHAVRQMLKPDELTAAIQSLTQKQLRIIDYVRRGLSSREISAEVGISTRTVEIHRYNIMKKLGLKNTATLINEMNLRGI